MVQVYVFQTVDVIFFLLSLFCCVLREICCNWSKDAAISLSLSFSCYHHSSSSSLGESLIFLDRDLMAGSTNLMVISTIYDGSEITFEGGGLKIKVAPIYD